MVYKKLLSRQKLRNPLLPNKKREMYEGDRLQVFYIRMIYYQGYKLNCRDTITQSDDNAQLNDNL
uniref:Uncharacterized protein n=1 Tax=Candidatus Methanogaster sp. ANME-2c ERB4 TaxID=2759911 RepID=A0A7G9YDC2_9EURY|nr:hypothetical protein BDIOFFAC_00015 [Methanosarcinales archaeon ANME-2c ERB4]